MDREIILSRVQAHRPRSAPSIVRWFAAFRFAQANETMDSLETRGIEIIKR